MLHYRRFMMIALAVAMVCLLTGVHACGGTRSTSVGSASQTTTTEFSSSAGGSNTDLGSQQQGVILAPGKMLSVVNLTGTLVRTTTMSLGGGATQTETTSFDINGQMTAVGQIGPAMTFNGEATVSIVQNGVIDVPKQGSGFTNWTGTDNKAVVAAWPMTGGTLVSGAGFSGLGSITYNCRGSGTGRWPGGPETQSQLTEAPGTIEFMITLLDGHVTIAVTSADFTGTLTGSLQ
jgi:hypothetical protein